MANALHCLGAIPHKICRLVSIARVRPLKGADDKALLRQFGIPRICPQSSNEVLETHRECIGLGIVYF